MTTMAQALAAVRIRLDEAVATSWTDIELRGFINEGVNDIARRTESVVKSTVITVLAGATSVTLPTSVLRINRVEWVGTTVHKLEIREFNELDPIWNGNRESAGTPMYFGLAGYPPYLLGVLYPLPESAGAVKVTHYAIPTAISTAGAADSSVLDIPAGWEDLVYEYASYLAQRRDANPAWQDSKREYEDRLVDMIDQTRHFHDQASQIIPDHMSYGGDPYGNNWGW